jgi:hypothetical protein
MNEISLSAQRLKKKSKAIITIPTRISSELIVVTAKCLVGRQRALN